MTLDEEAKAGATNPVMAFQRIPGQRNNPGNTAAQAAANQTQENVERMNLPPEADILSSHQRQMTRSTI